MPFSLRSSKRRISININRYRQKDRNIRELEGIEIIEVSLSERDSF